MIINYFFSFSDQLSDWYCQPVRSCGSLFPTLAVNCKQVYKVTGIFHCHHSGDEKKDNKIPLLVLGIKVDKRTVKICMCY